MCVNMLLCQNESRTACRMCANEVFGFIVMYCTMCASVCVCMCVCVGSVLFYLGLSMGGCYTN